VPSEAVSVCPATGDPVTVGGSTLTGGRSDGTGGDAEGADVPDGGSVSDPDGSEGVVENVAGPLTGEFGACTVPLGAVGRPLALAYAETKQAWRAWRPSQVRGSERTDICAGFETEHSAGALPRRTSEPPLLSSANQYVAVDLTGIALTPILTQRPAETDDTDPEVSKVPG
jgi:hypothetical protein